MSLRLSRLCLAAAGLALAAGAARAQLTSDDVPQERTVPEKAQIERDLQRSRWHLGSIRLLPSFAITNAGYDSNVYGTPTDPVSDWTFSIQGGLRFLLPLGTKLYFRADALPSYTWYDKVSTRRSFGGVADASLFAFFNHMTVELTGYGAQEFEVYSTELSSRVLTKSVGGVGAAEVELTPKISAFARGEYQTVHYDNAGQVFDVAQTDHTDTAARGGIRYRAAPNWSVSTAYEQTWTEFDSDAQVRNNQSRAVLLGLHYDAPRLFVNLSGGYREGRPKDGSSFTPYSTPTGSFFVSFYASRWLELQVYGKRGVIYSLNLTDPYFIENQIGGGINIQPLDRVLIKLYGTTGPNEYPNFESVGGSPAHNDQRTLFGGGVSVVLAERAALTGLITRIDTDYGQSTTASTAVTRYTLGISLSGELQR